MSDKSLAVLDSIYNQALDGLIGQDSIEELARDYLKTSGSLEEQVDDLIRVQVAKCSVAGFMTGLGGLITLPITLPADLAASFFIQIRMVGAIAYMGGHDIHSDQVRTAIYLALCGGATSEILRNAGIKCVENIASQIIQKQSTKAILDQINKAVGIKLITQAGGKGAVNLTKLVPLLGGIVGAVFDGAYTNKVGDIAKKYFIQNHRRR